MPEHKRPKVEAAEDKVSLSSVPRRNMAKLGPAMAEARELNGGGDEKERLFRKDAETVGSLLESWRGTSSLFSTSKWETAPRGISSHLFTLW